MSPIHVGQSSSAAMPAVAGNGLSTDSQSLRAVHDRLLEFIAAHSTLSKVTLALADSIVEFYLPEDDGFAPAVAFQTMAADGTSGLLCAQIQALVQTALRPLARFTAEMGEVDTMVKICKEASLRSQHYSRKVNDINAKLEGERREDRRAVLQEKAARNNAKLSAAHRERKEVSDKVYRLMDSSHRSKYACFNPVFASICQFQEATYSHAHLLSTMLLSVVRSSLGSSSLPMAAADAPPSPSSPPKDVFPVTGSGSTSALALAPSTEMPTATSVVPEALAATAIDEAVVAAKGGEEFQHRRGKRYEVGVGIGEVGHDAAGGSIDGGGAGNAGNIGNGNGEMRREERRRDKKSRGESDDRDGGSSAGVSAANASWEANKVRVGWKERGEGKDEVSRRREGVREGGKRERKKADVGGGGGGGGGVCPMCGTGGTNTSSYVGGSGSSRLADAPGTNARATTTKPIVSGGIISSSSSSSSMGATTTTATTIAAALTAAISATTMTMSGGGVKDTAPTPMTTAPTTTTTATATAAVTTTSTAAVSGSTSAATTAAADSAASAPVASPSWEQQNSSTALPPVSRAMVGFTPALAPETPAAVARGGENEGRGEGGPMTAVCGTQQTFLEGHLPWGKRRRMSGMLLRRGVGGGRGATSVRQTFCVAEGPELLMYNSESDSIAGESPRARFLVKGARSVPKGRSGGMELEVTVIEEADSVAFVSEPQEIGEDMIQPLASCSSTRTMTLVAAEKHEHARWALALDEAKSWKEEVEREALLEELELSLPFRECALRHLRQHMPDAIIEDIMGVTAAKNDPGCVLKRASFTEAVAKAAALAAHSSPENSVGAMTSSATSVKTNTSTDTNTNTNTNTGAAVPPPQGGQNLGGSSGFGGDDGGGGEGGGGGGGGGVSRRSSVGHTSSLRGLLSRFESSRSPREHASLTAAAAATAMAAPGGGSAYVTGLGGNVGVGPGPVFGAGFSRENSLSGGGTGAAGGSYSRWSVGGKGRKRAAAAAAAAAAAGVGTNIAAEGKRGDKSSLDTFSYRSYPASTSTTTTIGNTGGGGGGVCRTGVTELGSPLRRSNQGRMISAVFSTTGGSIGRSENGRSESGRILGRAGRGGGMDDDYLGLGFGDFVGGGHALCRFRSRTQSRSRSNTTGSTTTVFDMFSDLDGTINGGEEGTESSGRHMGEGGVLLPSEYQRQPSRERTLILNLLQDGTTGTAQSAQTTAIHNGQQQQQQQQQQPPPLGEVGVGVAAASAGGKAEEEGENARGEPQSVSAPCSPTGDLEGSRRRPSGNGGVGGGRRGWNKGNGNGSGSGSGPSEGLLSGASSTMALGGGVMVLGGRGAGDMAKTAPAALVPSWRVVVGGGAPGEFSAIGEPGAGAAAGGGVLGNDAMFLQRQALRPSGINPYLARRPSVSSKALPESSLQSFGGAGGDADNTASAGSWGNNKKWMLWGDKEAMPPLPSNNPVGHDSVGKSSCAMAAATTTRITTSAAAATTTAPILRTSTTTSAATTIAMAQSTRTETPTAPILRIATTSAATTTAIAPSARTATTTTTAPILRTATSTTSAATTTATAPILRTATTTTSAVTTTPAPTMWTTKKAPTMMMTSKTPAMTRTKTPIKTITTSRAGGGGATANNSSSNSFVSTNSADRNNSSNCSENSSGRNRSRHGNGHGHDVGGGGDGSGGDGGNRTRHGRDSTGGSSSRPPGRRRESTSSRPSRSSRHGDADLGSVGGGEGGGSSSRGERVKGKSSSSRRSSGRPRRDGRSTEEDDGYRRAIASGGDYLMGAENNTSIEFFHTARLEPRVRMPSASDHQGVGGKYSSVSGGGDRERERDRDRDRHRDRDRGRDRDRDRSRRASRHGHGGGGTSSSRRKSSSPTLVIRPLEDGR